MEIRQANLKDLLTLQYIGQATYKQHFSKLWTHQGIEEFLIKDFSLEALQISLADDQQIWFLIFDENKIAQGFAKLNLQKYEPHLKKIGTELQKIYLLDSAIQKNYSHIFLQTILDFLGNDSGSFIYLEVLNNNIRAQKFYKKYHFKEEIEVPYSTDLYDIGMKIMTRTLSTKSNYE